MSKRTVWMKRVAFAMALSIIIAFSGVAQAAKNAQRVSDSAPLIRSSTLPRATPESKGVSSEYILNMLNEIEKRNLQIDSIAIAVDGKVIFDAYAYPYNRDTPFITFSLSKLFANTAVGLAYTEGKLKLTDRPVDYFPASVPANASDNLKAMTVRDLITMRNGHDRQISGNEWRSLKTSWIDHFMKEPVPHKPGSVYKYSSGNTFMLSAMVQKVMGKDVEELLQENLYQSVSYG